MTKHTPGPWEVDVFHTQGWLDGAPTYSTEIVVQAQNQAATVCTINRAVAAYGANARLVACAPELLAMAERYARECDYCGGDGRKLVTFNCGDPEYDPCENCADLRALIARAKGETT